MVEFPKGFLPPTDDFKENRISLYKELIRDTLMMVVF